MIDSKDRNTSILIKFHASMYSRRIFLSNYWQNPSKQPPFSKKSAIIYIIFVSSYRMFREPHREHLNQISCLYILSLPSYRQNTSRRPPFSKIAAVIETGVASSYKIIVGTIQRTYVSNFMPQCIVVDEF
jgi:hypothetical protein